MRDGGGGEKQMKVIIKGSAKEIADFTFLLQSQREVRRKPYTNETELQPVIRNAFSRKRGKKTKRV